MSPGSGIDMKHMRLIVIWAVLASVAVLIAFSIFGAFVDSGVLSRSLIGCGILRGFIHAGLLDAAAANPAAAGDRGAALARGMFNSPVLVGFWIFVTILLLVGFIFFRRLIRSPGLLAIHVGCVLVLVGAMYGSPRGHAMAARLLGINKIPSARMEIHEGQRHDTVVTNSGWRKLPFQVGLWDFWTEYYQTDAPWGLMVDFPPAGDDHRRRGMMLDWKVGREIDVPFTGARLKVLQYLPGTRPVYESGVARALEVTDAEGNKTTVAAEIGREVSLKSPKGVARIRRVFSNLLIRRDRTAVDVPGAGNPPALELEFEDANSGKKKTLWAFPTAFVGIHGLGDGVRLRYVVPEQIGVAADPDGELPAMEVLLSRDGKELREWLFVRDKSASAKISLMPLLGLDPRAARDANDPNRDGGARDPHGRHRHDYTTYLELVPPAPQPRDWKSHLAVIEAGRIVMEKVIEVNDPLHYGGYHFYQSSFDVEEGRYTILSVRSDSGLRAVYVGFFLVCAGTFWLFWLQPAFRYLAGPREDRGDGD